MKLVESVVTKIHVDCDLSVSNRSVAREFVVLSMDPSDFDAVRASVIISSTTCLLARRGWHE